MRCFGQLLSVIVATVFLYSSCCGTEFEEELEDEDKWPTISVSILVKNMAHSLPFSLTCLEKLDYPKDRLYIWFSIIGNADESRSIIEMWSKKYESQYYKIQVNNETQPEELASDSETNVWSEEHYMHLIKVRETSLNFARAHWAEYVFMLDADAFLTEPKTLKRLIRKKRPVVAPLLVSDGVYSNFWDAMSETYNYVGTERYQKIIDQEIKGCFEVPMVHSAVLINLRNKKSDLLTYDPAKVENYQGPVDDILTFAISASTNDINMTVCNDRVYGFLPVPVEMNLTNIKTYENDHIINLKLEALSRGVQFPLDPILTDFVQYPKKDRLGLDRVYMINLERRTERRHLMDLSFLELGIEVRTIKAIDGLQLKLHKLATYGVTLMPFYEDPFSKRPMKAGEVGCFLSHYNVWKEIAQLHLQRSLILEDDVRFTPNFRRQFDKLLEELETLDWDLVYVGRKILQDGETIISAHLSKPLYSYWTVGYLLSEAGARKLIQAEPLAKMLPVDEFLPIMFDQHPNDTWKSFFPRRDLKAYSASPLLVYPTHYTGQPGYISDTEDSHVLPAGSADGEPSQEERPLKRYEL